MGLLLDLAYLIACIVLSPWIVYRLAVARGRLDIAERLSLGLGQPLTNSIWLHGSSAGEVSLLRPLIERLERDAPGTPLVISAFTTTGLAAARRLYGRHRVVALPLDLSFVVRRALTRFDPRLLIVVESEFWPNFIGVAHGLGIPIAVVNGKMSPKSHRIHARLRLVPRVLAKVDMFAVQTEEHAQRLRSLGVSSTRVRVTGNMKYDLAQAPLDAVHVGALRATLGYASDDVVVIGGSLHQQEDEALLDAFLAARTVTERAALIVAPRYPADAEAAAAHARERGCRVVRKTDVDAGRERAPGRSGVLLVDTVGDLGRLYAAADLAFVGGSLFFRGANKGGHNLMEPAIAAVPVLFGPYNFSFKETVEDLLEANAGVLVHDPAELRSAITRLVRDERERRDLGTHAQRVVRSRQGVADRNYELVVDLLRAGPRRLQGSGLTPHNAATTSRPDS